MLNATVRVERDNSPDAWDYGGYRVVIETKTGRREKLRITDP